MEENYKLEEALAKYLFYTKLAFKSEGYKKIRNYFAELNEIANKWLDEYSKSHTLNNILDDDIKKSYQILDSLTKFDIYEYDYYDYIYAFLDSIVYYINKNNIIKGEKNK